MTQTFDPLLRKSRQDDIKKLGLDISDSDDGKLLQVDGKKYVKVELPSGSHTHSNKAILDSITYTPENQAYKVSSFQEVPSNVHYPSEKLVKDSLDLKVDINYPSAELDNDGLKGQPVYVKSNGHIDLAKADSYLTAKVAGILNEDKSATFSAEYINNTILTLSDWTDITGSQYLIPNNYYFLSTTEGMYTNIPPTTGYITKVGQALTQNVLQIEIEQPIGL